MSQTAFQKAKGKTRARSAATNLSTSGNKGGIGFFRRKYVLNYRDEKPEVYKLQIIRGKVVKGDELVAYAANAAHVPESTVRMASDALFQAINYYCANGRLVQVPGLGGFGVQSDIKSVQTLEEIDADTVKMKKIRFYPKKGIAALGRINNLNFKENLTLSKICIPELAQTNNGGGGGNGGGGDNNG